MKSNPQIFCSPRRLRGEALEKNILLRLCLLVVLLFPIPSFAQGFQNYSKEINFAKQTLDCSEEKVIPAAKDFGALYICTFGKAKTARWFVSEKPKTGGVQNVGLMWVDWQIDNGYGIRADWEEAEKALDLLIDLYVPTIRNDLTKAFWDSKNEDFSTADFTIYYTFKADLHKDERIVVIEEK